MAVYTGFVACVPINDNNNCRSRIVPCILLQHKATTSYLSSAITTQAGHTMYEAMQVKWKCIIVRSCDELPIIDSIVVNQSYDFRWNSIIIMEIDSKSNIHST